MELARGVPEQERVDQMVYRSNITIHGNPLSYVVWDGCFTSVTDGFEGLGHINKRMDADKGFYIDRFPFNQAQSLGPERPIAVTVTNEKFEKILADPNYSEEAASALLTALGEYLRSKI